MKCIKHGDVIKRVKDEEALRLVGEGKAVFCAKKEWKIKVRDQKRKEKEEEETK